MAEKILYNGLTREEMEEKLAEREYEMLDAGDIIDILLNGGVVGWRNIPDEELLYEYKHFFGEEEL